MGDEAVLETLGSSRYVRLTTFRRDGTPVPTAVWIVRDGDLLLVTTAAGTGKVKRLRHTPRVLLAPSDRRGRVAPGTTEAEGTARIVQDRAARDALARLVARKYGLPARLLFLANRLRRSDDGVRLEITVP